MMCRRTKFCLAAVAVLMLSLGQLPAVAGGTNAAESAQGLRPQARLLSSTAGGVTFEIDVPWQSLSVEAAEGGYVRVALPGWTTTSQAGAPALPALVQAVGVPFGAAVEIAVTAGRAHTQVLAAPVQPAPTLKASAPLPPEGDGAAPLASGRLPTIDFAVEESSTLYGAAEPYPGSLAKVASDGVIRQQRVAGIAAYPVQYNPSTRELTVYETVRVVVAFGEPTSTAGRPPVAESPAYEGLFRGALLNYETARAWRQAMPPSPTPAGARSGDRPQQLGEGVAWAPPNPGWRLKVRADGFYKVTYAQLQAAGLPVDTLDPRTFRLFYLGSEAALEVAGEADGAFDPGDYVVFYGQAVESKYTRDNVYWLTFGQANGLRMGQRDGTPGSGSTPDHFTASLRAEQQTYYIPGLPGDEELERWLWDYVYAPSRPSRSISFTLNAPFAGELAATLSVAVWGGIDNAITPDHHARFYLNGTLVGDTWWDGLTWHYLEVTVPQQLLVQGSNTLLVECPNDTGVGVDLVYMDRAALEFAGTFTASGNEIAFGYEAPGTWLYEMDGFSGDGIAAYDVTDPHAVVRIEGVEVIPSGSGYAARMEDEVGGALRYRALAAGAYRSVQAIEPDLPSDLQSTSNGADHVVVTHSAFWNEAGTLSDFRAGQGLRAMRVDLQDVYDEFGYGVEGIAAIRDFFAYAYAHWQAPAPSYALLVGDGHYDPKNYYGFGLASYLPPYLAPVDPWTGETAADNRYVTLVGDDTFPDMMLGRLAVNSSAQAAALVSKIVAYEESPEPGDWNQRVLAVADNGDSGGNFSAESDALLSSYLPEPYEREKVYYLVTHQTVAAARQAIQDGINGGRLVVNYIGHGSSSSWASEGFLTTADVPLLQNGGKLPVMLPMTCYEGYYHYPFPANYNYDALAEVITRAEGRGAVASWSPTGAGVMSGHSLLNTGFYQAVFLDGVRGLGEATTAGKLKLWATGSDLDLLDTYLLFGDPAMEINALEPQADLAVSKSVEPAGPVLPGDTLIYTLTFANNGPAGAQGIVLSDPIPTQLVNAKVIYMSPEVIGVIPGTTFDWQIADLPAGATGSVKVRGLVGISTPAGEIVNTASIAGSGLDPSPDNNTASVSTTVLPVMRVASIVPKYTEPAPGRYTLSAQLRISDLARVPVDGATVSVQWTFPNGSKVNQQGMTDLLGRVNFRTKSQQTGTHQVCVTDVVKTGVAYAPARNLETCDTVVIP